MPKKAHYKTCPMLLVLLFLFPQTPVRHPPKTMTFPIQTLNYIHGTAGQGIILHAAHNLSLETFSDSDWGACVDTSYIVIGYLLFGDSPISWKSKKQSTVSISSSEVE